jgi:hypothetical protein
LKVRWCWQSTAAYANPGIATAPAARRLVAVIGTPDAKRDDKALRRCYAHPAPESSSWSRTGLDPKVNRLQTS